MLLVAVGAFLMLGNCAGIYGSMVEDNGMLLCFIITLSILDVTLLGIGASCFLQRQTIIDVIGSKWTRLQRSLPPQYANMSQQDFQKFVQNNLSALGFVALIIGGLILIQIICAFLYRRRLVIEENSTNVCLQMNYRR